MKNAFCFSMRASQPNQWLYVSEQQDLLYNDFQSGFMTKKDGRFETFLILRSYASATEMAGFL